MLKSIVWNNLAFLVLDYEIQLYKLSCGNQGCFRINMIHKVIRKHEHRLDINSTTLNTLGFLEFCLNRYLVAILVNRVRELPSR